MPGTYNRLGLYREVSARYASGDPIHGLQHALDVETAAVELASELGADAEVGSAFGLLHDACRQNGGHDPEHGARAAALAVELRDVLGFANVRLQKLLTALELHDAGRVSDDLDVSVCWAADRLQLRRVGIEPARRFFCARTWPLVLRMLAGERGAAA